MCSLLNVGPVDTAGTVVRHRDLKVFRDRIGGAIFAMGSKSKSTAPYYLAALDMASCFFRSSGKLTALWNIDAGPSGSKASLGQTGMGRALAHDCAAAWPAEAKFQFRVKGDSGDEYMGRIYVPPQLAAARFQQAFAMRPTRVSDMVIINQVADDKAGPYTPEQAARAAGEFATSALRYTIQVIHEARSLLVEQTMMGRDEPLSDPKAIRTAVLQHMLASGLYRAAGVMMMAAIEVLASTARPQGPCDPRSGLPPPAHDLLASTLRPLLKEAKANFALVEKFFEGVLQSETLTLINPDVSATHSMIVLQAYPVLYLADALVNERRERPAEPAAPTPGVPRDRYLAGEFLPLPKAYSMVVRAADYMIDFMGGAGAAESGKMTDAAMWAPIDALSMMNVAAGGVEGVGMRRDELMGMSESEAADLLESVAVLSGIPEKRSRGTPYGRISQDFMVLATLPELALHVLNAGVLTPSRLVELAPSSLLEPLRRNILNARAGRDAAGPTEGSAESRDPFDMLMMRVTADPGGRAALHHLLATEGEGSEAALQDVIQSLTTEICLTTSGIFADLSAKQLSRRKILPARGGKNQGQGGGGVRFMRAPTVNSILEAQGYVQCALGKYKRAANPSLRRAAAALTLEAAAQVLSDTASLASPPFEDFSSVNAWGVLLEDIASLTDIASDTSDAASGEGTPEGCFAIKATGPKGDTWPGPFRAHMTAAALAFAAAAPQGVEPYRAWLSDQVGIMDSLKSLAPPPTWEKAAAALEPMAKGFGIEPSLDGALALRPILTDQLARIAALRARLQRLERRCRPGGAAAVAEEEAAGPGPSMAREEAVPEVTTQGAAAARRAEADVSIFSRAARGMPGPARVPGTDIGGGRMVVTAEEAMRFLMEGGSDEEEEDEDEFEDEEEEEEEDVDLAAELAGMDQEKLMQLLQMLYLRSQGM